MSVGAFAEPLAVLVLLFGGTWVNRNKNYSIFGRKRSRSQEKYLQGDGDESPYSAGSPTSTDNLLEDGLPSSSLGSHEPTWRRRAVKAWRVGFTVTSPNTRRFKDYYLSRVLLKFPFLVEAWYWALIYWVYQLGRAFTALSLVEGTVNVARRHALEVISLERKLNIFWEPAIQAAFMKHDFLMHWINRIYSFIHIPGTILFLVCLYYYTTVRNRVDERRGDKPVGDIDGSPAGPKLYEARRRTMAVCNLLAFIVFTAWPCMPPRLLSDKDVPSSEGQTARSYGFVDTVHGASGESSVWTQNRFCNQYAAMPSLHFGYALMIGLTIATIPLSPRHRRSRAISVPLLGRLRLPSPKRLLCMLAGTAYATMILIAIVATANHFILDAVAGAGICALGWWGNGVLLNLLPLEDYFLWCVRIHKPQWYLLDADEDGVTAHGVVEDRY